MPQQTDDHFYNRADAHIHLANEQLSDATSGIVSASFMYAASRFNAWRSACGFQKKEDMQAARAETIAYFVTQYEKCLTENLDDYIENFEQYMKPPIKTATDDQ
jgi:hypothetical protein